MTTIHNEQATVAAVARYTRDAAKRFPARPRLSKKAQQDSDFVFGEISRSLHCKTFRDACWAVCVIALPDPAFSREGISDAVRRLGDHYRGDQE